MFVAYVHVFECGLLFPLCIFTGRKLIVFPSCRFWLGRRYGDIVKHFIFPPYLSNRQDDVKFLENHPFSNFKNSPATNHHAGHSAASPE